MAAYYEAADLVIQAALLISGIALAHAFLDGNKRTALLAGTTFLDLNGLAIERPPEELGRQIEALVHDQGAFCGVLRPQSPRLLPCDRSRRRGTIKPTSLKQHWCHRLRPSPGGLAMGQGRRDTRHEP